MANISTLDSVFQAAGTEWNVDPALLKAIATQESGGNTQAVSRKGAQGLMQIMPDTAKGLGVTDPTDPVQSIFGGAKYLSEALDNEGHPETALLYYHGGPGWRQKYGTESANYVPAVAAKYQQIAAATPKKATDATAASVVQNAAPNSASAPATSTAPAKDTPESDADFLKRTAAPVAGEDDDAAFLARTGGVATPPATPPPEPPLGDNAMGDQGGMGGSSMPAAPGVSADQARNFLAPAPNTVYGDVLPLARDTETGKLRLAMPNMLRMPLQGLAAGPEAGATIDPGTGQLGITPEAASVVPFAATPLRFSGANPLQFVPPGSMERAPIPADAAASILNPDAAARIRAAQGAPVPVEPPTVPTPFNTPTTAAVPGVSAEAAAARVLAKPTSLPTGVPVMTPEAPTGARGGAVGADITTAPIPPKTPVERVRDLEKTVLQTAEDRAGPRMQDDTQYVPGIPPRLLAGRDFSTSVNALDEKIAVAKDPAFRDTVDRNNRDRNQGMIDFLRNDAQDANALDQAYEFRKQVSPKEMGVFDGEQPVNAEGLLSKIDRLLNGPEGKQKAVRNTLNDARASLFDADGNLETLPSRLYGARKNLTDLLQRGVKGTGELADDVRASKHHLEGLVEDFDPLITGGAPRFTDYLKEWSARSKPIDQMEFLQQYQTGAKKLTNDTGYLQPNKVQKMLDDVLQTNKARGVNKGKSLTDQQIANIEAVRNELQAQQLQDRLANVRGSDTFQQFSRPFLGEGAMANALRHGVDVVGGISTGGLYNWAIKPGLQANRERRIQRKTELRKQQLLEPPNPLAPP